MKAALASIPVRNRAAVNTRARTLITPEGIALPLVLASRGARAGALLLDLFLIGLAMLGTTLALVYIAGGTGGFSRQGSGNLMLSHALEFLFIVWLAAMFLFRNAYFLFFELGPRGATPGKRAAGIRIAARNGGRLTPEMVIARNLLRDIELFLPLVLLLGAKDGGEGMGGAAIAAAAWFLIFAFFCCFNRDRMRAGDLIAGTWVVEAPKRTLKEAALVALKPSLQPGAQAAAYRFSDADLAVYGEFELQTLERVLRENRPDALVSVTEAICRKIGWNPGAGDEQAFLQAYYTQLRARLEGGMRMGKRKADKFE